MQANKSTEEKSSATNFLEEKKVREMLNEAVVAMLRERCEDPRAFLHKFFSPAATPPRTSSSNSATSISDVNIVTGTSLVSSHKAGAGAEEDKGVEGEGEREIGCPRPLMVEGIITLPEESASPEEAPFIQVTESPSALQSAAGTPSFSSAAACASRGGGVQTHVGALGRGVVGAVGRQSSVSIRDDSDVGPIERPAASPLANPLRTAHLHGHGHTPTGQGQGKGVYPFGLRGTPSFRSHSIAMGPNTAGTTALGGGMGLGMSPSAANNNNNGAGDVPAPLLLDNLAAHDTVTNRYDGMIAEVKGGVCAMRRREVPGLLPINIGQQAAAAALPIGASPETINACPSIQSLLSHVESMAIEQCNSLLSLSSSYTPRPRTDGCTASQGNESEGNENRPESSHQNSRRGSVSKISLDRRKSTASSSSDNSPYFSDEEYASRAIVTLLGRYAVAAVAKQEDVLFARERHTCDAFAGGSYSMSPARERGGGADQSANPQPDESPFVVDFNARVAALLDQLTKSGGPHSKPTFVAFLWYVICMLKDNGALTTHKVEDRISKGKSRHTGDATFVVLSPLSTLFPDISEDGGCAAVCKELSRRKKLRDNYDEEESSLLPSRPLTVGSVVRLKVLLVDGRRFPSSSSTSISASPSFLSASPSSEEQHHHHHVFFTSAEAGTNELEGTVMSEPCRMLCDLVERLALIDPHGWLPDSEWTTVGSLFLFSYDESVGPTVLLEAMESHRVRMRQEAEAKIRLSETDGSVVVVSSSDMPTFSYPLWFLLGNGASSTNPLQRALGGRLCVALETRYREPVEMTSFLAYPLLKLGARGDGDSEEADVFIKARTLIAMGERLDDRAVAIGPVFGAAGFEAASSPADADTSSPLPARERKTEKNEPLTLDSLPLVIAEVWSIISKYRASCGLTPVGIETFIGIESVTASRALIKQESGDLTTPSKSGAHHSNITAHTHSPARGDGNNGPEKQERNGTLTAPPSATTSASIFCPEALSASAFSPQPNGDAPESSSYDPFAALSYYLDNVSTRGKLELLQALMTAEVLRVRPEDPKDPKVGSTSNVFEEEDEEADLYVVSYDPQGCRIGRWILPNTHPAGWRGGMRLVGRILIKTRYPSAIGGGGDSEGAGWRSATGLTTRAGKWDTISLTYRQLLRRALGVFYTNCDASVSSKRVATVTEQKNAAIAAAVALETSRRQSNVPQTSTSQEGDEESKSNPLTSMFASSPTPPPPTIPSTSSAVERSHRGLSASISLPEMFLIVCLQNSLRYMATDPVVAGPQQRIYGVGRGAQTFVRRPGKGGNRYGKGEVIVHKLISSAAFHTSGGAGTDSSSALSSPRGQHQNSPPTATPSPRLAHSTSLDGLHSRGQGSSPRELVQLLAPGRIVYFPGPILGTASVAVKSWTKMQLAFAESRSLRPSGPIPLPFTGVSVGVDGGLSMSANATMGYRGADDGEGVEEEFDEILSGDRYGGGGVGVGVGEGSFYNNGGASFYDDGLAQSTSHQSASSSNCLVLSMRSSSALLLGNYCHLPRSHDCMIAAAAPWSVRGQAVEIEAGEVTPTQRQKSQLLPSGSLPLGWGDPQVGGGAPPSTLAVASGSTLGLVLHHTPSNLGARRRRMGSEGGMGGSPSAYFGSSNALGFGGGVAAFAATPTTTTSPIIRLVEMDDKAALHQHLKSLMRLCPSAQSASLVWQLLHSRAMLEICGSTNSYAHAHLAAHMSNPMSGTTTNGFHPPYSPSSALANTNDNDASTSYFVGEGGVVMGGMVASPTAFVGLVAPSAAKGASKKSTAVTTLAFPSVISQQQQQHEAAHHHHTLSLNWMIKHKSSETSFREALCVWGLVINELSAERDWEVFAAEIKSREVQEKENNNEKERSYRYPKNSPHTEEPNGGGDTRPSLINALAAAYVHSLYFSSSSSSAAGASNGKRSQRPLPSRAEAIPMPSATLTLGNFMFFMYPPQLRRALAAMNSHLRAKHEEGKHSRTSHHDGHYHHATKPTPAEIDAAASSAGAPCVTYYMWLDGTDHKGQLVRCSSSTGGTTEEPISVRRSSTHPSQRCLEITDADIVFLSHQLLPLALPVATITITHSDMVTETSCEELFASLCGDGGVVHRLSLKGCRVSAAVQEELDALTACVRLGPPYRGELRISNFDAWVEEWGRNGLKNQLLVASSYTDHLHDHSANNNSNINNGRAADRGASIDGAIVGIAPPSGFGLSAQGSPFRAALSLRSGGDVCAEKDRGDDEREKEMHHEYERCEGHEFSDTTRLYSDPSPGAALAALGRVLGKVPLFMRHLVIEGSNSVTVEEVLKGLIGLESSAAALPLHQPAHLSAANVKAAISCSWASVESLTLSNLLVDNPDESSSGGEGGAGGEGGDTLLLGSGESPDAFALTAPAVARATAADSPPREANNLSKEQHTHNTINSNRDDDDDGVNGAKGEGGVVVGGMGLPVSIPMLTILATAPSLTTLTLSSLSHVPMGLIGAICEAWQRREAEEVAAYDEELIEINKLYVQGRPTATSANGEKLGDHSQANGVTTAMNGITTASDAKPSEEASRDQEGGIHVRTAALSPPSAELFRDISFVKCELRHLVFCECDVDLEMVAYLSTAVGELSMGGGGGMGSGPPPTYSTILFDRCYFPPLQHGGASSSLSGGVGGSGAMSAVISGGSFGMFPQPAISQTSSSPSPSTGFPQHQLQATPAPTPTGLIGEREQSIDDRTDDRNGKESLLCVVAGVSGNLSPSFEYGAEEASVSIGGSPFAAAAGHRQQRTSLSQPTLGNNHHQNGNGASVVPSLAPPQTVMEYLSPYLERLYEVGVRLEFRGCDGVPNVVVEGGGGH